MRARRAAVMLALASSLSACASAPPGRQPTPLEAASADALAGVASALERALQEADAQPRYRARLRHNPARCEAPPFEVFTRGRWQRVIVQTASQEVNRALDAMRQRASAPGDALLVWLAIPGEVARDARGVSWPVVDLLALDDPASAPALTQASPSAPALAAPCADHSSRPHSGA